MEVLAGARAPEDGDAPPTSRCSCAATAACSYQDLMDVFDRLKAAGVEKVGIVAQAAGASADAMDVTDILRDRDAASRTGLQRMAGCRRSRVHVALVAALLSSRRGGLLDARRARRETVMTISLGGGGDGPANGGMTAIGGRPVQAQTPPENRRSAKPVRPPAAKTPEMTVPMPDAQARRSRRRQPTVKQAPDEARGRTPTRGAEVAAGQRDRRDRRARPGLRAVDRRRRRHRRRSLDVGDFCCPDYLATMVERIRGNWKPEAGRRRRRRS